MKQFTLCHFLYVGEEVVVERAAFRSVVLNPVQGGRNSALEADICQNRAVGAFLLDVPLFSTTPTLLSPEQWTLSGRVIGCYTLAELVERAPSLVGEVLQEKRVGAGLVNSCGGLLVTKC